MKQILLIVLLLVASLSATFAQSYNLSSPEDLARLHNDGLNYIGSVHATSPDFGNLNGLESNRSALMTFYNLKNLPTNEFPSIAIIEETISSIKGGNISALILSSGGSQSLADQLNLLLLKCNQATSVDELENEIISFLNTISGSENEIFTIRTAAYTAINSAKFWEQAALDTGHPFHIWAQSSGANSPGGEIVFGRVRIRWWRLPGDAVGAAVGIIIGGGTPAGVAGGAALGALVSSNIEETPRVRD